MKRMTKLLCGAALVFTIIGFAFCIASLCFGFSSGDMEQVMAAGGSQFRGIRNFLKGDGGSPSEKTEEIDFQQSYSGIKKLKIDVPVAECLLIPSADDTVQVIGYGLPSGFSCKKSGDKLHIEAPQNALDYLGFYHDTSYLEIWIPENLILDSLEVDAGVGEVTMEDGMIICREADIQCGVGSCSLNLNIRKKLELECGVGEIDLYLAGRKEDYNYRLECGIGSIEIGDDSYSELGGTQKIDHGAVREVSAECGVGSVAVMFEDEMY